ncbi:MAG: flavodoxin family protein [Clostridia bacterium]|nr:flavodoxin family protein [Clostridia bacterium]
MKIVVINGSPRGERSNTLLLTNAFIEGMKSAEAEVEVDVVTLKNKEVQPCMGCFACWSTSPGKCVINDDVRDITAKMFSADLVIYSFPLFYYALPSKLKALVERQLPTTSPFMTGQSEYFVNGGHPPRFTPVPKTVLISTCGFYPTEKSYDAIRAQFNMICGEGGYDEIFVGEGELFCKPLARRRCNNRLEVIKRAGAEYATSGKISAETLAEATSHIFPPDMYATMADEGWGGTRIDDYRENDAEFIRRVKGEGKEIKTIY